MDCERMRRLDLQPIKSSWACMRYQPGTSLGRNGTSLGRNGTSLGRNDGNMETQQHRYHRHRAPSDVASHNVVSLSHKRGNWGWTVDIHSAADSNDSQKQSADGMNQQWRRRAGDSTRTRRAGQIHITSVILINTAILSSSCLITHNVTAIPSIDLRDGLYSKDGKICIMWKRQWTQGSVLGHSINAVTSLSLIFLPQKEVPSHYG